MKIERQSKTFTPITITIESQVELDALLIGMNHSIGSFRSFSEVTPLPSKLDFESLNKAKDDFWEKVHRFK